MLFTMKEMRKQNGRGKCSDIHWWVIKLDGPFNDYDTIYLTPYRICKEDINLILDKNPERCESMPDVDYKTGNIHPSINNMKEVTSGDCPLQAVLVHSVNEQYGTAEIPNGEDSYVIFQKTKRSKKIHVPVANYYPPICDLPNPTENELKKQSILKNKLHSVM